MQKILKSKKFLAGTLAVLCTGILIVCFVVSIGKNNKEFVPDPLSTGETVDTWDANPASSSEDRGYSGAQGTNDAEEYPKVVEENENAVVIDFTDPSPAKADPPRTSGTNADQVDHDAVPVQTPSSDGKPQENPTTNTPAPGSTNGQGQVYDPAFGWITPAEVIQKSINSDGDPNKMVGDMD